MDFGSRPMNFLGGLNKHVARHKNRDFLDAALAVSVLATQADGTISLSERYRIDGILERVERLRIYDSHQVAQILDRFLADLRENPEAAREGLLHKLERVAEDRKMAELIVRIALSVSHSGGGYDAAKRARVAEICAALGYTPECIPSERRLDT